MFLEGGSVRGSGVGGVRGEAARARAVLDRVWGACVVTWGRLSAAIVEPPPPLLEPRLWALGFGRWGAASGGEQYSMVPCTCACCLFLLFSSLDCLTCLFLVVVAESLRVPRFLNRFAKPKFLNRFAKPSRSLAVVLS